MAYSGRQYQEEQLIGEQTMQDIYTALDEVLDLKVALNIVLKSVQQLAKCSSVAIRLRDVDEDYPYYVWIGFANSFILKENSLIARQANGSPIYIEENTPLLECMCGNTIMQRAGLERAFRTKGGSFWTNNTSQLVCSLSEESKKNMRVRTTCCYCGYQSVAIIPIKAGSTIVGLLQLNDSEANKFTSHLIEIIEEIGRKIGFLIRRSQKFDKAIRLEKAFKKVFRSNPSAMALIAASTKKVIDVNDSFLKLIGYKRQEIIGYRVGELENLILPDDLAKIRSMVDAGKKIRNYKCQFTGRSARTGTVLISIDYLTINKKTALLVTAADVTELANLNRQIDRLNKLHLAGQMAASIGHEIRNPMTTVRGYLQLLQRKSEFEPYKEQFATMIEEIDKANSIITDFLGLAKNRISNMKMQNINNIIRETQPLLAAMAVEKGHSLEYDLSEVPDILLDKAEIHRMIINLVKNSFEAIEHHGRVIIRTSQAAGRMVLTVEDNGRGIPSEFLDKLGTPFFTTKDTGAGLGLAVCYKIADRHKAVIDVTTSSRGSIFTISFPI